MAGSNTSVYRGAGGGVGGAASSISVGGPSGTQVGDLLILLCKCDNTSTWTVSTGWSKTFDDGAGFQVWTKTATGDSTDTAQVAFNATPQFTANVIGYGNVAGFDTAGQNNTETSPSITASYDALAVRLVGGRTPDSSATAPSGTTFRRGQSQPLQGGGGANILWAAADATVVKGATGSAAWSMSSWSGSAVTMALYSNRPPNAPTLNSPSNNATIDRTSVQRFAWTFSDPDPGDSQSQFDLRYAPANGSYPSTPQVSSAVTTQYYDMPANTLAAGNYQFQVRNYDSQGVVGPWSQAGFFTAATPPAGPTITYPTSGGTVQASDSIQWSYPTQAAYQVQRCADNAGAIDTTTVYYDSGTVNDPNNTIRSQALTFATNNRYEWLRLRIMNGGLWSSWVQERVQVSYTPPPVASGVLTVGQPNPAAMSITITNPAPASGAPAATSNVVLMSPDGGTTVEWSRGNTVPVAPNATVVFYTPTSGATYSYCIIARADNGTTSTTGWITPGTTMAYGTGAYGTGSYGGAAA